MKIIENKVPKSALITKVKDQKQLFALLLRKRIDYAVFIKGMGQYYLRKNNIKGVAASNMPLDSVPAYIYLHPKHAALVPRLAGALQEMKKNGSFQRVVDRHLQAGNSDYTERLADPTLEKK